MNRKITRKVTYTQDGSFVTVIPKTLAMITGITPGCEVSFELDGEKLVIAPVAGSQPEPARTN